MRKLPMPQNWGYDRISNFIDTARQNTFATYDNLKKSWNLLERVNEAFWNFNNNLFNLRPENAFTAFFSLKAHSSYLGAVRLSTSGQLSECYMVLRGCLENSLYGFYLYKKPDSIETWLRRHDDEENKKKVRREFRIDEMLKLLSLSDSKVGEISSNLYDFTIDYGGHPNERALTSNLLITDTKDKKRFQVQYLSGHSTEFDLCLRINAQVGVCSLLIFRLIYRERFDILGLSEHLLMLKRELWQ
jgi:hypothetical protein